MVFSDHADKWYRYSRVKTRVFTYFCFFFLFIYFFLVFQTNFSGPDEPIYYAYTESLVEDGDLNVVNNLDSNSDYYSSSRVIEVSKTYNFPDFHNHGGVILWAPFYASSKLVHFLATKFNIAQLVGYSFGRLANCLMSFSTVVFGFFVLILTYVLCRYFFPDKISLFSTLAICFGTPFFYFLLFEVGNAQILAALFSVLSIGAIVYIVNTQRPCWFVYGLFFGVCIVVKVDIWFQIFCIGFLFVVLLILRRITLANIGLFILGIIPLYLLKSVNDYIKYGSLHVGEVGIFNPKSLYLTEMLFSTYRGYFYTSPILYVCLLGLILVAVHSSRGFKMLDKTKEISDGNANDFLIFILGSYLYIKVLIISCNFAWGGGTPGARPLLTEFPIFVILYARVLQTQRKILKGILIVTSMIFVFWNLLVISEYIIGVDLHYVLEMPKFSTRIKSLEHIVPLLFSFKEVGFKLIVCSFPILVISGAVACGIMFWRKTHSFSWCCKGGNNAFKAFCLTTICLSVFYASITSLNIYNNKKNVEDLKKKSFFSNSKILTSREFEKKENVKAMDQMIEYFILKGDLDRVAKIERQKIQIYGEQ